MRHDIDRRARLQSQMFEHPRRRKHAAVIGREFEHARVGKGRGRCCAGRGGRHLERERERRILVHQHLGERSGQQKFVAGQIVARVNRQPQTQRLAERSALDGAWKAMHAGIDEPRLWETGSVREAMIDGLL